jgi:hypothetical protein
MIKQSTLVLGLFATLTTSAFARHSSASTPVLEFQENHRLSVTQVCIDHGHLRPFHPVRQVCAQRDANGERLNLMRCPYEYRETITLKLPITQVTRYNLDDERTLTRVNRIQTRDIEIPSPFSNPFSSSSSTRKINIPNCPNSMIERGPELIVEAQPTEQERIIFTALFQRGITIVRQETSLSVGTLQDSLVDIGQDHFTLQFAAPQCQGGAIEFSEEFITYLRSPMAHDFLFRRIGGEGSGSGKYHPGLNLRLIGGEGSGSGRIVGGEGSGSGRALEGRYFDPLTSTAGELQVQINIPWTEFINGNYIDRDQNPIPLVEDLLHGEQVPEETVHVECR